jgi:large subunit ribosomal protein L25
MQPTSIPVLHAERIAGQIDEPTLFQFIRNQNRVPAVLLARRGAKEILSVDCVEIKEATRSDDHPVVRIDMNEDCIWARVAEVGRDSFGGAIWYVEVTRLPKGEVVAVDVPVHILHRSPQRRYHDVIVEHLQSVRIEGPVEWLPPCLNVDARRLRVPESITVADLDLPNYCEPLDVAPDTPVASAVPAPQTKAARTAAGQIPKA